MTKYSLIVLVLFSLTLDALAKDKSSIPKKYIPIFDSKTLKKNQKIVAKNPTLVKQKNALLKVLIALAFIT